MKNKSLELVKYLGKLSNIPINKSEATEFSTQVEKIIDYIGEVQKVKTSHLSPTSQVIGKLNEFREDVITPPFSQQEALGQTNLKTHNGYFVVDAVLDE